MPRRGKLIVIPPQVAMTPPLPIWRQQDQGPSPLEYPGALPGQGPGGVAMVDQIPQVDHIVEIVGETMLVQSAKVDGQPSRACLSHGIGVELDPFRIPAEVTETGQQRPTPTTDVEELHPRHGSLPKGDARLDLLHASG